jgi:hypothetical protein
MWLLRNERGHLLVEYPILVWMMLLIGIGGIVTLGPPLLESFRFSQMVIVMPLP